MSLCEYFISFVGQLAPEALIVIARLGWEQQARTVFRERVRHPWCAAVLLELAPYLRIQ